MRVFTFAPGQFDPDRDFLLDNELRQKAAQQNRDEQAAFIRSLCKAQPGCPWSRSWTSSRPRATG